MKNKVLVIAAHPDDEILGCGASIAKRVKQGDSVHTVIMAEGITSREAVRDRNKRASELSQLAAAAKSANETLGVHSLELLNFPDNRMDSVDRLNIIKEVEAIFAIHQPDIVYTHHANDLNIDHRRVHEAVITVCRPQPESNIVKQLLFFEIPSSTEWQMGYSTPSFQPNWFDDVTDSLAKKMQALEAYQSEMRSWPHARSVEAVSYLAKWRGACIGVEAAEAFSLGRYIGISARNLS
ncbi:MAG: PIG-L family deacetylase [Candidatus Electrothrix sp. AW2]|nr:PIG-L family deacetylase [Candidatus Electrothrix gigas]